MSQTTVSLVLNGKADALHRISPRTRDRVLSAIREAAFVADPVARSLAGASNHLIGVFTYEHSFPTATSDVDSQLLRAVEAAAERAGSDLLMFTSSPVVDGRRRLFDQASRLRLADGCLLLGREMDGAELGRLVDRGHPFVAIGRRDAAGGRVPYVGADYAPVGSELVRRALALGHRRIGLLHLSLDGESSRDRRDAIAAAAAGRAELVEVLIDRGAVAAGWARLAPHHPTVVVVEDPVDALELCEHLAAAGMRVPQDLSVVALGDTAGVVGSGIDLTGLVVPRARLAERALAVLLEVLEVLADPASRDLRQELLPCALEPGSTLVPPGRGEAG